MGNSFCQDRARSLATARKTLSILSLAWYWACLASLALGHVKQGLEEACLQSSLYLNPGQWLAINKM